MSIFKQFSKDDYTKTPYIAHKKYLISIGDSTDFVGVAEGFEQYGVTGLESIHVNSYTFDPILNRTLIQNQFTSGTIGAHTYTERETTNGHVMRSLHDSLAHMYYNGSHCINVNPDESFCTEPTRHEYRELNGAAQIFSVPQQIFGDKIHETDVNFDADNPALKILSGTAGNQIDLRDDGFGNLYEHGISFGATQSLTMYHNLTSSCVGYWGFNELYPFHQNHVLGHCPTFFLEVKDGSQYNTPTLASAVFVNSQSCADIGYRNAVHGTAAMFTGQSGNAYDNSKFSYVRAKHHRGLDFRKDEDFAISLWINAPQSQSNRVSGLNYILSKGQGHHSDPLNPGATWTTKYPFDLSIGNSVHNLEGWEQGSQGKLIARRHDGINQFTISSSSDVTGSWVHAVYQKTGSNLELWINGTLESTLHAPDLGNPGNNDDLYLGLATRLTWSGNYMREEDGTYYINPINGQPKKEMVREFMRPYSGSIDELRIYDRALHSDEIDYHYELKNGTPFVGNVMHEHGIITITHPSESYRNIARNCTMSLKNTFKITEHEYTANIKRGEYNFTMNPSITKNAGTGSRIGEIESFVTDTDWDPYITTIGLYNSSGELLIIGKLSRALRKDDGYDTTLVVRFDT